MAAAKQLSYRATDKRPLYSMLRHSPAFVMLAIVIADGSQLADPDLWNNLRAGQIILSTHHLTLYDSFSYTAFGHLWRNHEWLSQVALAATYNYLGVFGLKLMKLLCAAAIVSLISLALAETEASPRVQRAVLALTAVALLAQIQFRPQLASFVLLSLILVMLARDTYRSRAMLWPMVPIFALWANLHGGYLVGIAAVFTYAAVVAADDLRHGVGFMRTARLIAIAAGCTLATLANPDGIEIWRTVTHSIADPLVHRGLAEWQPLLSRIMIEWRGYPLGVIIYLLPLALFVALVLSLFLAPSLDDVPLVAIAALFIVGAFVSVRNMALAVIVLSVPLSRHLGMFLDAAPASFRADATEAEPTIAERARGIQVDGQFNPVLAIVLTIAIVLAGGLLSNRLTIDEHCPVGAVAFMQRHNLHGNLLSSYDWGNYLTWHTSPPSKIFIDGRSDQLFPPQVIRDYYDFYYASPRAQTVLDQYPHDFVLLPPDADSFGLMAKTPQWKLIYRDPDAALFARATSPAAQLPIESLNDAARPKLFP
ncbi:MAG TPA: hypothetical protein VMB26_08465 [Candidatus Binataceae bacterium]|nr:hypothetical protein [Candidatus Binataceae bacterium]